MTDVVRIRGLDHRYGTTHALRGVDLTVAAGECVALLGPNGAGKTTLVSALTGTLAPTAGAVRIDGADPRLPATRRRLGVVHQHAGFPRTLSVRELVGGWAVRAGRPASDADAVLTEVGLQKLTRRRVTELSGGQQQRLQLAMALVVDPTLLVLDEPTVGLDIEARRRFWTTLAARRDRGTAVLLTTHQIEEAAGVADRVVVLHEGAVIASGRPADLTAQLPDRAVSARTVLREDELGSLPGVLDVAVVDGRMRAISGRAEATVRALLAADPAVTDLRVEGATLEQAIVAMTTQQLQEVVA
ncbi:ABC transporter ATP-binding protein [Cellulomonas sp. ATA003]|uniref:ABC transporter ATP-binding protein n=1 Tax=Cellulomonas sp. ATA003 TaxID=3073064 RepID=UPI002872B6FD|nr:ABC transporter ATP-binding protein [Cellulomonas sp. ATA003]WNB84634.1 ABC transporter ATP-binding protein [Cellulomonas sp. ATA003]